MNFKPQFWPTLIAIPALIVLLSLGTWQVKRLGYKTDLIQEIDRKIDLAEVPLPPAEMWGALERRAWHYRPVKLKGVFDHTKELHVFTHISDSKGRFQEAGYTIMTPLTLSGTKAQILVSRGFVPEAIKVSRFRPTGQTPGEVSLHGLLRFTQTPNYFTPEADLKKNIWFIRDIPKMTDFLQAKNMAPFFVELKRAEPQPEFPRPRAEKPIIKNNHLSYAITWYGIALGLIVIYFVYHLRAAGNRTSKNK